MKEAKCSTPKFELGQPLATTTPIFNVHTNVTHGDLDKLESLEYPYEHEDDARLLYHILAHHVGKYDIDMEFINSIDLRDFPESECASMINETNTVFEIMADEIYDAWPEDINGAGGYQARLDNVHVTFTPAGISCYEVVIT